MMNNCKNNYNCKFNGNCKFMNQRTTTYTKNNVYPGFIKSLKN